MKIIIKLVSNMLLFLAFNAQAMSIVLRNGTILRYSKNEIGVEPKILSISLPNDSRGLFSVSFDYNNNNIYAVAQLPYKHRGMSIYKMDSLQKIGFIPGALRIKFLNDNLAVLSMVYVKDSFLPWIEKSGGRVENYILYGEAKLESRERKKLHVVSQINSSHKTDKSNYDEAESHVAEDCTLDNMSFLLGVDKNNISYFGSKCYEYRGNRSSSFFDGAYAQFGSSINSFDLGIRVSQTNDILNLLSQLTSAEPCLSQKSKLPVAENCDSMACDRRGDAPRMCKGEVESVLSQYSKADVEYSKKLGYIEIIGIFDE